MRFSIERKDSDIVHYGVLGMKWGIRRYQPYREGYKGEFKDINRALKGKARNQRFTNKHTIPKGTTFYRVAPQGDPASQESKAIYATYLGPDRDFYRGSYLDGLKRQYNDPSLRMYERKYQLKEDLKVPSKSEQRAAFDKVMKDKKNMYSIGKTAAETIIANNPVYKQEAVNKIVQKYGKDGSLKVSDMGGVEKFEKALAKAVKEVEKEIIDDFTGNSMHADTKWMYEQASLGKNTDIKKKVIAELQKRGYNAMVDYASVGGIGGFTVEGIEPVIIFDQNNSLELKSEKKVTYSDQYDADLRYREWKGKAMASKNKKGSW